MQKYIIVSLYFKTELILMNYTFMLFKYVVILDIAFEYDKFSY